jgi:hypothetical protein
MLDLPRRKCERILICGPRKWDVYLPVFCVVAGFYKRWGDFTLIHGDAPGVDRLAAKAAETFELDIEPYPADWSKGAAAGPVRNRQMLTEGKPDLVCAIGYGRGTIDMTNAARQAGVLVLWRYIYVKRFYTP